MRLRALRIVLACAALAAGLGTVASAMGGDDAERPAPPVSVPPVSTLLSCDGTPPPAGALTSTYLREFCAPASSGARRPHRR